MQTYSTGNQKCKCCNSIFNVEYDDGIVDMDRSGQYLYFCSYDCKEKYTRKDNKNARANRNERRNQKHNYNFGDD